jgi:hypothetical protein
MTNGDVGRGFVRPAKACAGGTRSLFSDANKTLQRSTAANIESMADAVEQSKNLLSSMTAAVDKSKLSVCRRNDGAILYTNGVRPKEIDNGVSATATVSTSSSSIEEIQVVPELVTTVLSLREATFGHEDTIRRLKKKLSKLESRMKFQSESTAAELNSWKEKHSLLVKALQREKQSISRPCSCEGNREPSPHVDDRMDRRYQDRSNENELMEKIRHLTHANGQLLAKCQKLGEVESQRDELLVLVEELRVENDAINRSMDEAMQLMSGMRQKMVGHAREQDECVRDYETQVANLMDEIDQAALSRAELNMSWSTRLEERKEEVEKLRIENREAYQTCEVLQREIDMLYKALEESKAGSKRDIVEKTNGSGAKIEEDFVV